MSILHARQPKRRSHHVCISSNDRRKHKRSTQVSLVSADVTRLPVRRGRRTRALLTAISHKAASLRSRRRCATPLTSALISLSRQPHQVVSYLFCNIKLRLSNLAKTCCVRGSEFEPRATWVHAVWKGGPALGKSPPSRKGGGGRPERTSTHWRSAAQLAPPWKSMVTCPRDFPSAVHTARRNLFSTSFHFTPSQQ